LADRHRRAHASRRPILACVVTAGALALPAAAQAIVWGSPLTVSPTQTLSAPVDAAYWAQSVPGGHAVAPKSGQVTLVKIRGKVVSGQAIVLFQDLRPEGGKLKVISTTGQFTLSHTSGIQSFKPVEFFVNKGDHVALATIGGSYQVLAPVAGAKSEGFVGAGADMNGSALSGTARGGELQLQVTER
jgi:hypothetical protein